MTSPQDGMGFKEEPCRSGLGQLQYFLKDPAKAGLAHFVSVMTSVNRQEEQKLAIYGQVVSYHLTMYATEDVIVEVEATINYFKQPKDMYAVR